MRKFLLFAVLGLMLSSCLYRPLPVESPDEPPYEPVDKRPVAPLEFIVQFKEAGQKEGFERDFAGEGIFHLKRIAPNPPMHLYEIKTDPRREQEILERMKTHESVVNAQTNKEIQGRN